jgi:hypothetical protein
MVEHYNKSRTVIANDPDDPDNTAPQELVVIAATGKPTDGGSGNAL